MRASRRLALISAPGCVATPHKPEKIAKKSPPDGMAEKQRASMQHFERNCASHGRARSTRLHASAAPSQNQPRGWRGCGRGGATSSTPLGLWGDEDGGERRRRPPRPDRLAGGEGGRATLNRPLPNGSGEKNMRKGAPRTWRQLAGSIGEHVPTAGPWRRPQETHAPTSACLCVAGVVR